MKPELWFHKVGCYMIFKAHCQTATSSITLISIQLFFQKTLLCVTTVLCCFDLSAVGAFVTPTQNLLLLYLTLI